MEQSGSVNYGSRPYALWHGGHIQFSNRGITGIFLADFPTDLHLQDTFWVVAHFHYTIVSTQIFGLMAAIYYWFPKLTGRMDNERLGKWHFLIMFITFNTTFSPMFWFGINGMNRRVAQYLPELSTVNQWVSISAFVMGASFLIFLYNMSVAERTDHELQWSAGEVSAQSQS